MTIAESCAASAGRAVVIAAVAVASAELLRHALPSRPVKALLVALFLMPSLIVGYAYQPEALLWRVDRMMQLEVLYVLLVAARLMPLAVLLLCLAPPPPNPPSAVHVMRLSRQWSPRLWAAGPARTRVAAFGVVALLAFQEFEIASVFNMHAWAVWLFQAQTGGLALRESLIAAAWPLAGQLILIAALLALLLKQSRLAVQTLDRPAAQRPALRLAAWGLLIAAACGIIGYPGWHIAASVIDDLDAVAGNLQIIGDVGASLFFATLGAAGAIIIAMFLRRRGVTLAALCCAPGLLGSLLIGLCVIAMFQWPPIAPAYHRPLPTVIALVILLVPPALILMLILGAAADRRGEHAGDLLQRGDAHQRRTAARLRWQTRHTRFAALAGAVFYLGYFDLAASSLLSPPGMTPIVARLYNLTHYGQNAVLSAMLALSVVAPIAVAALLVGAARLRRAML